MPEVTVTKRTRWECVRCGECCNGFIISKKENLSVNKNGKMQCRYLENNECINYDNRPFICNLYPFIIDLDNIVDNEGVARPQRAFRPEKLKIHTECSGYGKGKRVYANKKLLRELERIGLEFAEKFKESFEQNKDFLI